MKNSKLHPASGIYLALVMLFLYLPIFMLIVLSFNGTNSTSVIQAFRQNGMLSFLRTAQPSMP